jgi:hypothetical protein
MMKFFRKHTKHLLAFFMALLLLVWLGGDALTYFWRSNDGGTLKQARAQAYGKQITLADMLPSMNEAELLDSLLSKGWRYPWAQMLGALGIEQPQVRFMLARQIREEGLSNEEWYMLDLAARQAGIRVPMEAVERFKADAGLTPEHIDAARASGRQRASLDEVDRALQSYLRVNQAVQMAIGAVKVSEADIREMVRQTGEKAKVVLVTIEAKPFIDNNYQPTPQELQAQFDKYKNVTSQPAGGQFGYQLPEEAQLEYIVVNSAALTGRQKVTDEEMYAYWTAHKNEFTHPASQPATGSAPTTRPKPQDKPYDTFTEARAKVREKMLKSRADAEALRIARDLIAQLQGPWATAPTTQPGNYKIAPESVKNEQVYPKLVDTLQAKYPGVLSYGRTQREERDKLSTEKDLGRAVALASTPQQITIDQAAFMVPGLEFDAAKDKAHERFFRGLYETVAEPFITPDGKVFVIRTVSAAPKRPPASLDEVKTRVIEDIRAQRAYEQAGQQAKALAAAAATQGLDAAFTGDAALKTKLGMDALKKPEPFARKQIFSNPFTGMPQLFPNSIPGAGYDAELADKVFALGGTTATQPVRVGAFEQKERQQWLVVQLLDVLPVTQAEFDQQRNEAMGLRRMQDTLRVLSEYYNADQIRARVGWKDLIEKRPADKAPEA